jgi:xanthine dehydrogenase accessory factor
MHSQDKQVLSALHRWTAEGHRVALVTVVRTWGSAPRPAGAWLALRDDGMVQGSVSGGCIEDDLVERMRAGEFAVQPVLQRYGVTQDEAARFGLPCGGTLELLIEPAPDAQILILLAQRLSEGHLVRRTVSLATGAVTLSDACRGETMQWDGQRLTTVHGPRWRMLIIGAGQIARYLAPMAIALDHAVSVCDPRAEYAQEWDVAKAPMLPGMPDDVVLGFRPDPHTAIVALTHDPKLDDMALLEAFGVLCWRLGISREQCRAARPIAPTFRSVRR